jgi:WD repeat/SOCS box-containing protein 2
LAFSLWPSPPSKKHWAHPHSQGPDVSCLILATGLNDGQIKIWEVQTGLLLLNLSGHQDVVRDLSFTPSGSLILVSASRDKTLRIWDLNKHGREEAELLINPQNTAVAPYFILPMPFLSRKVVSQYF